MKSQSLIFACLLLFFTAYPMVAQQTDPYPLTWKDFGITGSFQMKNRQSLSIGFGRIFISGGHADPNGIFGTSKGLFSYTLEHEFVLNDRFLYAPKLGMHLNMWLFYVGASTAYYTDFHGHSCWAISPELGAGFIFGFILWNPTITIADFGENITQHNLTLKVILPLGAF